MKSDIITLEKSKEKLRFKNTSNKEQWDSGLLGVRILTIRISEAKSLLFIRGILYPLQNL